MTGCVSQSKYDRLVDENRYLHEQLDASQSQLAASQTNVRRLQGAIKYTVESDLLFAEGSWQLTENGKEILSRMAKKLAPTQQNRLVVNGYTDSTPIGPELQRQGVTSNKELSEKRADAVKQFLISQGVNPNLVTSVGHGETHPVARNDTANGRAQNRRVELTLGG